MVKLNVMPGISDWGKGGGGRYSWQMADKKKRKKKSITLKSCSHRFKSGSSCCVNHQATIRQTSQGNTQIRGIDPRHHLPSHFCGSQRHGAVRVNNPSLRDTQRGVPEQACGPNHRPSLRSAVSHTNYQK